MGPKKNWRDVVKSSLGIDERLKRNVLEIHLEKEEINDVVEEDALAKFFLKIGVKQDQVEGVQLIPPKSPRKVFLWLQPGIDLNQYCHSD